MAEGQTLLVARARARRARQRVQGRHAADAALRRARRAWQERRLVLELRLIADVSIVASPTRANPRPCPWSRAPDRRLSLHDAEPYLGWSRSTAISLLWPTSPAHRGRPRGRRPDPVPVARGAYALLVHWWTAPAPIRWPTIAPSTPVGAHSPDLAARPQIVPPTRWI